MKAVGAPGPCSDLLLHKTLFNSVVEKQVCPASVLTPLSPPADEGAPQPSYSPPAISCGLSVPTLRPHLLFTVRERAGDQSRAMLVPSAPETGWKEAALRNRFVTMGTKTGFLSVVFTKMTSSNTICREAGSIVSSHKEANTRGLRLKSKPPGIRQWVTSLGIRKPRVAGCSLVLAAGLGFFTPNRGCNVPSPNTHRGAELSDCKQISTSLLLLHATVNRILLPLE